MKDLQRSKAHLLLIAALVGSLMLAACGGSPASNTQSGSLNVMVSIVPQQYFVERIGGDLVNTQVMVEPGNNPATYEPKPEQLKELTQAAAYFSIGVPFENTWLDRIAQSNRDMLLVDTIANIQRVPIEEHQHRDKDHDADHDTDDDTDHEHAQGAPDPHVWLSPQLVKIQSQTIYDALVALDPAHEDEYRANLDAFLADIEALEAEIVQTLSGLDSAKFMVFHPSWGYFADDFGLEQIAIEVGGQEPSAQELAQLIRVAQEEGIRVVFAQPEFSTRDAETIAQEINGRVLLVSPLAQDWLDNMRQVAQTFAEVLGE